MNATELLFFWLSCYGASWIVTKSTLFKRFRLTVRNIVLLGHLVKCIVCFSVWVAVWLWANMACSELLGHRRLGALDGVLLICSTAAFVWLVAQQVGDAD